MSEDKIYHRNPYLRVKLKTLAEEARIIRKEERLANGRKLFGQQALLHEHRVGKVRSAARETLLAYQFLRGFQYEQIEQPDSSPVDWGSVARMVNRYRDTDLPTVRIEDLQQWSREAHIDRSIFHRAA